MTGPKVDNGSRNADRRTESGNRDRRAPAQAGCDVPVSNDICLMIITVALRVRGEKGRTPTSKEKKVLYKSKSGNVRYTVLYTAKSSEVSGKEVLGPMDD